MRNVFAAVLASAFMLGAAPGFAQGTYKKIHLTEADKTEIRERVDRLRAERTKAEATKAAPAAPVKAEPKRTSKTKTPAKPKAGTTAKV